MSGKRYLKFEKTVAITVAVFLLLPCIPIQVRAQQNNRSTIRPAAREMEAFALRRKFSPDLEQQLEVAERANNAAAKQRVIIQLKSLTPLNEMLPESISDEVREEMFAGEVRANQMRAITLKAKIAQLQGKFKKAFNRLGLLTAELPLVIAFCS